MPKFVATDYTITIGGSPFTSSLASVSLDIEVDEQETTPFGSTYRTRIGGLRNASATFDFHQDFASGSVDQTLFTNLGGTVAVTIKPTSGSTSPNNPIYSFNCLVTQTQPFANSVGDLATMSVTWPVDGAVTRGTA
jgi:hypothetical protein